MKLVIFDCDGTLVDSEIMILAAMRQAYAAHGLSAPPRERLLSIVGLSLPEAFGALCANGAPLPVPSLIEHYKAAFAALRQSPDHVEPLYPGARDVIEDLAARADVVLGIATGKSRRGVAAVLGRHGLLDRFLTVQTADTSPSKPHPSMVLEAMREAGVAAQDTVVVGDSTYDIVMARAAGATSIGVAWGYHAAAALREAGADAVVDEFAELLPAIERAWQAPLLAR